MKHKLLVTDETFLLYDVNMQSPIFTEYLDC